MVTSRFLDTITFDFAGVKRIEINASAEDLQMYVEGRLLEHVRRDPELRVEIIKTIVGYAQTNVCYSF
jgi:hypothetical protein